MKAETRAEVDASNLPKFVPGRLIIEIRTEQELIALMQLLTCNPVTSYLDFNAGGNGTYGDETFCALDNAIEAGMFSTVGRRPVDGDHYETDKVMEHLKSRLHT